MNLTNHFLVSMPQMQDTIFRDSVVYVLSHGDHGAFGVIINDYLEITLGAVLSQMDITVVNDDVHDARVYHGGPVDETHGLVLHKHGPTFEITHDFDGDVSLSSSRDVLEAIARADEPHAFLLLLGHAGWAPGQLEMEVSANAWLTCAANTDILFDTPLPDRRQAVADLLGFDLSSVVGHYGHA